MATLKCASFVLSIVTVTSYGCKSFEGPRFPKSIAAEAAVEARMRIAAKATANACEIAFVLSDDGVAHLFDRGGVRSGAVGGVGDDLVARFFAFDDESPVCEPQQRVEPEHGSQKRFDEGDEVIAPRNVCTFVREQRFQLVIVERLTMSVAAMRMIATPIHASAITSMIVTLIAVCCGVRTLNAPPPTRATINGIAGANRRTSGVKSDAGTRNFATPIAITANRVREVRRVENETSSANVSTIDETRRCSVNGRA